MDPSPNPCTTAGAEAASPGGGLSSRGAGGDAGTDAKVVVDGPDGPEREPPPPGHTLAKHVPKSKNPSKPDSVLPEAGLRLEVLRNRVGMGL